MKIQEMNLYRIVIAAFVLLLTTQGAFANKETLAQGWEAFNQNKRTEARELFKKATADATTKADAYLALSFLNWSDEKDDESFNMFSEFLKASDNPYPYLYALWTSTPAFSGYGKKEEKMLKMLNGIIADPKAHGTLKAMAHSMLGSHYEYLGDFKKSEAEYDQIGSIDKWQVLGTFDNTSASGFGKDFGALQKGKPGSVFKNEVNADVTWFTPPHTRSDRWFDFAYYFPIGNSIMYAQTFLQSDKDQEVFFRSGNSGSLKIWVNDKLITDVAEERNCDLDVYTNNVKLNKGYNRVLVQIGESETDRANFMIRVTDKDGHPITGVSETPTWQDYTKAADYKVESWDLFAEDFFENKAKAEPNNLANYILLSEVYLRNDKVYEARKALKKAKALAPNSSFVGLRMLEAYQRDKNVTDLTKEYERIKAADPELGFTIRSLITEADEREDYDEVEKLLAKYEKAFGTSIYTELKQLGLAADRKKYDEMIKMSEDLYKKYPENFSIMSIMYKLKRNTSKDLASANQILKAYLKHTYSDDVMTTLAGNYFDLGNKKEATNIYNQRVTNFPYAIGYYVDLTDLYFNAQEYPKALEWAKKTLEFAPYVGRYWNNLGKVYSAIGNTADAKEAFRKAIYYQPTNYDARKQLRKLEKAKDYFDNFEKVDAYEMYKKAPGAEAFPEDNSVILLNEIQRVVYPEGATEERAEVLIKVFNKNGIDTWKEYSIYYNSYRQRLIVDKAEVFKKDGNKVQAEKNDNYIVFTDLEAGDAIHVSYRIESYNTGKLAQHLWEQFNFNFSYPVQLSRYSLLMPAAKTFKHEVLNADIKPKVTDVEDFKLYVWEAKDQPGILDEAYMPGLSDVGIVLDISTIPDWQYVSNWYSDLSTALAKTDFEVKETVAELFAGKTGLTDLQKAKLIYEYIEQNVTYSDVSFMHGPIIPQKASRTLNTKLGDCKDVSTLFVAMCKEVGLTARLILVDTRENGERHLNLPSIDFNHCIAELRTGGKSYYIELTDQKLSFSSLPLGDLNANALIIPRDGDAPSTGLIKLNSPNRPRNSIYRTTEVKFDNSDLIFTRKSIKTGALASGMRNEFSDVGKEKQEKAITQSVAGGFSNTIKLIDLSFGDLTTLADSVDYSYTYQVKNEVQKVLELNLFKIPWGEGIGSLNFLSEDKRTYPFLLWYLNAEENSRETVTVILPKGKVLAEQPKSVTLNCGAAEYSLTYTTPEPGKLVAVREMKYTKDIVPPADYALFKDFYHKVAEADTKQIVFK